MKEIIIDNINEGQRLDRFLAKYLKEAGSSFIYKMLRKKNITLNDKKATGNEKLKINDTIKIFFSDETLDKFTGVITDNTGNYKSLNDTNNYSTNNDNKYSNKSSNSCYTQKKTVRNNSAEYYRKIYRPLDIVYEDDNILLVNKPVGMLSQKASTDDVSLSEYITAYLLETGYLSEEILATFKSGICNRLDRNTSGIVAAGKTTKGLQMLSELFKSRELGKYYICIVCGEVKSKYSAHAYLNKNENANKVSVISTKQYESNPDLKDKYIPIHTEYIPIYSNKDYTLLKVHLVTGKSHQIRAHLSFLSHPLVGDYKYGNKSVNDRIKNKYNIKSQMLHAYELIMPSLDIHVKTQIPDYFMAVLKGEKLWEPGIPEDLEALH